MIEMKTQTGSNRQMASLAGIVLLGVATMSYASLSTASDGEAVYKKVCKMCHGGGIAGAPKVGDTAAWVPRIAKGIATLEEHAIKGFKGKANMPAKGGRSSLSDEEVKAAVAFMVKGSQ